MPTNVGLLHSCSMGVWCWLRNSFCKWMEQGRNNENKIQILLVQNCVVASTQGIEMYIDCLLVVMMSVIMDYLYF